MLAVGVELGHEDVVVVGAARHPRAAAEVHRARHRADEDYVPVRVGGHVAASLQGVAVAEALHPTHLALGAQLQQEDVVVVPPAGRGEDLGADDQLVVVGAGDQHVAVAVDRGALDAVGTRAVEAPDPTQVTLRVEGEDADVAPQRAAGGGVQRPVAEVQVAFEGADHERVARRVQGHVPCVLELRVAVAAAPARGPRRAAGALLADLVDLAPGQARAAVLGVALSVDALDPADRERTTVEDAAPRHDCSSASQAAPQAPQCSAEVARSTQTSLHCASFAAHGAAAFSGGSSAQAGAKAATPAMRSVVIAGAGPSVTRMPPVLDSGREWPDFQGLIPPGSPATVHPW